MRGPSVSSARLEIELGELVLLRGVAGEDGFDRVAALVDLVIVLHRHELEPVPVGRLRELVVEDRVLADRPNDRAVRPDVRVALPARAGMQQRGEFIRRLTARDLGEVGVDLGANIVRNVAALDRVLEIAAREIPRAELEVQHAELELHPRQVRVEEQHALERADRGFIVAARCGLLGELEADFQVRGILEHLLEQRIVVVGDDGCGCRSRLRLRKRATEFHGQRRGQQKRGRDNRSEKTHPNCP